MVTHLEDNQLQATKKASNNKKIIAIILTAIIVIALAASATAILMNSQHSNQANNQNSQTNNQNIQTNNQTNSQSWIKKGAYATYEGQATILSMTVSFDAKMEIIDLNETHMQISTYYNMSTPYGATENTTTTWVNRENMTFQPEGIPLIHSYNTQITIPNLGTRNCTVYEYSSEGLSAAYYVDNNIQWPIKMVMTSPTVEGQSYSMDINIVDTNIPGL
jgi:FlaG/FlaF family flagellin (archaellin)